MRTEVVVCGITGLLDSNGRTADALQSALGPMTDVLTHRGPDDWGRWIDPEVGVALGHRRLSIVDLTEHGHQPMVSPSGRYVLVYNGEIYNFAALRDELAGRVEFQGTGDTEVLLGAIEVWGLRPALERCNGMFALGLWDRRERTLALARDRLGEKPLYYGWSGSTLLFGSELKALRAFPEFNAAIDRDALTLYFRHNCVPAPYSVFKGIYKLPPGTAVTFGPRPVPGRVPQPEVYWSLRGVIDGRRPLRAGTDETLDALESLLLDAVGLRMHADVALGAFLSGGIDSSLVVALMQAQRASKVRTFTIAFDDVAYDEGPDARAVAAHLGTEHTELVVTHDDVLATVPVLADLYDEPFSDSSGLPTYLLSKMTREHVTVALSGDGGDEVFGGYNRYLWAEDFWRRVARVPRPLRSAVGSTMAAVPPRYYDAAFGAAGPLLPARLRVRTPGNKMHKVADALRSRGVADMHLRLASHLAEPESLVVGGREPVSRLTDQAAWPDLGDPVELMMYLDTITYLPDDILVKVDRAAMGVSLETRIPYLDHRVLAWAWSLPPDARIRSGQGKWLLRQLLYRYVPARLVERPKMGFGPPIGAWLRGPLRPWAEDLLSPRRLAREGYLQPGVVRMLFDEHLSGRADRQYELWDILMFQVWLEHCTT